MRAIPILVVNGLQLESEEAITFEFLKKTKNYCWFMGLLSMELSEAREFCVC